VRCPGVFRPEPRCFQNPQALDPVYHSRPKPRHIQRTRANIGFLRTCHQIYAEGINLLYSSNTFDFAHPVTFMWFTRTIHPQRLASITKLQIGWIANGADLPFRHEPKSKNRKNYDPWDSSDLASSWDPMWKIIVHEMPGLRSLWVQCRYTSSHLLRNPTHEQIQELLMEPMLELKGLKEFNLSFRNADRYGSEPITSLALAKKVEELAVSNRDE